MKALRYRWRGGHRRLHETNVDAAGFRTGTSDTVVQVNNPNRGNRPRTGVEKRLGTRATHYRPAQLHRAGLQARESDHSQYFRLVTRTQYNHFARLLRGGTR